MFFKEGQSSSTEKMFTSSPVGAKTRMYLKEQNRFTLKFNSSAILVHLRPKARQ